MVAGVLMGHDSGPGGVPTGSFGVYGQTMSMGRQCLWADNVYR